VLEKWLGCDAEKLLGEKFKGMELLKL